VEEDMTHIRSRGIVCIAALLAVVFLGASLAQAAQIPIPLTPATFNQDVVVEVGAVDDPTTHYTNSVTATYDAGTARTGNSFYGVGQNAASPTTGFPAAGFFVSAADPQTTYQIQSHAANQAIMLDQATPSATATFVTPAPYSTLSFLTSTGNGASSLSVTVNFSDGTPSITAAGSFPSEDWFNVTTMVAHIAAGRVNVPAGTYNNVDGTNPRLYQRDITLPALAGQHPISSLTLDWTATDTTPANTHGVIFAVSGTLVPEPASMGLMGLGALGLLARRRRAA
jgi:hypothetical protein